VPASANMIAQFRVPENLPSALSRNERTFRHRGMQSAHGYGAPRAAPPHARQQLLASTASEATLPAASPSPPIVSADTVPTRQHFSPSISS
jgi:hypothetical protein